MRELPHLMLWSRSGSARSWNKRSCEFSDWLDSPSRTLRRRIVLLPQLPAGQYLFHKCCSEECVFSPALLTAIVLLGLGTVLYGVSPARLPHSDLGASKVNTGRR